MLKSPVIAALLICLTACAKHPKVSIAVKVGLILSESGATTVEEAAFKFAVQRINHDRLLFPNFTIRYHLLKVQQEDSFRSSKQVCSTIDNNAKIMFLSAGHVLNSHIQSLFAHLDIPHYVSGDYVEELDDAFSVNLHPPLNQMNQALIDFMSFLKWNRVAILFDEEYGFKQIQNLLKLPYMGKLNVWFREVTEATFRTNLRSILAQNFHDIIVNIKPKNMNMFLKTDIELFDLEDFKYNSVNITAFRLIDMSDGRVRKVTREFTRFSNSPQGGSTPLFITTRAALVYDSVYALAHSLYAFLQKNSSIESRSNTSCHYNRKWTMGAEVLQQIRSVKFHGLTGRIELSKGRRHNFKLDVLKLKEEGFKKIGEWDYRKKLWITDNKAFSGQDISNVTLVVTTVEEEPYVMVRKDNASTGNSRFYGFCIDLLEQISQIVGFNYVIKLVTDGKYGFQDPDTGEWNGVVRELLDKKADLAVAAITINYARETAVDFTKPFLNLGISILYKLPLSQPTRLFSFLNPLAGEIWFYTLIAYILVSFILFVMARFSPYEWSNPHFCWGGAEILENQFSIANSFWFVTGTLLRQGSGLNPKAASTRIFGAVWWFFTLIIISSYTANLAAFLTVERTITPFESAEDLADQDEIEYGTLEGGSTMVFFRESKIDTYQKMWKFMENKKSSTLVSSLEEGIDKVLNENYAFLMESTTLEYALYKNCNLTQIGGLLDSKGFGVATQSDSPWRDKISLAILDLREKGFILMLYNKWWKNTGNTCNRDEKNKESKANALKTENIGGVFVVLLCGLGIAIIVAILEFCWNAKMQAIIKQTSWCSEMSMEFRELFKCRNRHNESQKSKIDETCFMPSRDAAILKPSDISSHNGIAGGLSMISRK